MDWTAIWKNTMDFVNQEFLSNKCFEWILLFLTIFIFMLAGKILSVFFEKQARHFRCKKHFTTLAILFESMSKPIMLFSFGFGLKIGDAFIWMAQDVDLIYKRSVLFLLAISVIWFFFRLVDVLEHMMLKVSHKAGSLLDVQLIPIIRKSMRIFVVIVGALYVTSKVFGGDIGTILAGMGIGGLAFALAAIDMLANFFGSITILFDKPFRPGDHIRIGNYEGTVDEIGFRSTRVRMLDGHYVSIPNQNMTNDAVENISIRPYIRRDFTVGIEYSSSPAQLSRAIGIIEEMLKSRQKDFPENKPGKVYFMSLASASLEIGVTYWYTPAQWFDYLSFSSDFNMELFERFCKEGISFAFPTQTLYLRKDSANDVVAGKSEGCKDA